MMKATLISLNYQVPKCDTSLDHFPVVLGSAADVAIRLEEQSVNDYHCQIDLVNGELVVEDLGSVHGTFVNNCAIEKSVLKNGDELAVGLMSFLVQCEPGAENYARPSSANARKRDSVPSTSSSARL